MNNQMLFDVTDGPETLPAPLPAGKDEMNFAEFPIALLTDKVPKNQKVIKFEDQIFDEKRRSSSLAVASSKDRKNTACPPPPTTWSSWP